jgi:hypothetical protein
MILYFSQSQAMTHKTIVRIKSTATMDWSLYHPDIQYGIGSCWHAFWTSAYVVHSVPPYWEALVLTATILRLNQSIKQSINQLMNQSFNQYVSLLSKYSWKWQRGITYYNIQIYTIKQVILKR